VKIRARGTAEIEEADLQSPEMIFHRNRGNVVVLENPPKPVEHVEAEAEKEAKPEVPESAKAEAEKKAKPEVSESAKAEAEKKVRSTNKVK
jgi:hypothetical protein